MSIRACLLCGKSLGRFHTGPVEFCSREHRNQYQMRQGMDRLSEANKVASLMRRRENAKLISAAQLMSDSSVTPRDFGGLSFVPSLPSLASLKPTPVTLPEPKVVPSSRDSHWVLALRPAGDAEPSEARLRGTGILPSQRRVVYQAVRTYRAQAAIPRAEVAQLRNQTSAPPARRREFGILRHYANRVEYVSSPRLGAAAARISNAEVAREPRGARLLSNVAPQGRALRISAGMAFRLPGAIRPAFQSPGPGPFVTPLIERKQAVAPGARLLAAMNRVASIEIAPSDISYRWPVIRNGVVSLRAGSLAKVACKASTADAVARACRTNWIAGELQLPALIANGGSNGVSRPGTTCLFGTTPGPISADGAHRSSLVPFAVEPPPFEYISVVQSGFGGGAPAVPAAPPKQRTETEERVEERFSEGFVNWTGGVDTWKLDAAGVRIGKLALLTPSMQWEDYDLEFLARIENRSVTWVFRALGLDEYYQATITKTPSGYEFSRSMVANNEGEGAVVTSVPGNGPGGAPTKTAITVRMRVRADNFSVSIDNQAIETWTDIRLPIGGIGFMAPPDDRARLYWVTISPAVSTSKEQWKQ